MPVPTWEFFTGLWWALFGIVVFWIVPFAVAYFLWERWRGEGGPHAEADPEPQDGAEPDAGLGPTDDPPSVDDPGASERESSEPERNSTADPRSDG